MKAVQLNGELAWAIVAYNVIENGKFKSVTGIIYEAQVENESIFYKGGARNNGEEEEITKKDFVTGFDSVQTLPDINTNTVKNDIPTSIYRKRTPFIGLLFSAKIINRH